VLALSQERISQPVRERLQTGTRMCGNVHVGAVDKEKTSLHVLKCTTDCLSNLYNPDQISRGGPFLPKKNGSLGTIFPLKISVQGTNIFRTKIPVTVPRLQPHPRNKGLVSTVCACIQLEFVDYIVLYLY